MAFEHDPDERRRRRIAPGAALAAFSALAFGAFFVGTNAASDAGGVAWTVAVNRSTSFAALALAVVIGRKGLTYRSADLRPAAVIGLLDAGANALFALALTHGMTSTVGVIGSLYPVTTVVLATVVLRERPRALQALGVVGVLVGVGLVVAWGGLTTQDSGTSYRPADADSSVTAAQADDGQRCLLAGAALMDELMLPLGLLDAPSPASVLVVDDNAGKRLAVRAMLAPLGHAVVEVDSGRAALLAVEHQSFAVILMDVSMPILDGYETAKLIRQRIESASTPIIFLTAYGRDETETASAYASGAVDFIFTPVLADVLRAKVSAFIHLFVQSRELQRSLESITALNGALRDSEVAHARGAPERGGRDRDRRRERG